MINYVRTGTFSGSGLSLRDALLLRSELRDIDLYALARDPSLAIARARAVLEAHRSGGTPWSKTASWSAGNQRLLERRMDVWSCPVVIVQTMAAFVPPAHARYVVYTDRVSKETEPGVSRFHSAGTRFWAEREVELVRRAKHVFVMGPSTKDALIAKYGVDASRCTVVGAAPNFEARPKPASSLPNRILFVGTNWELKGGSVLLAAFARLQASRPDVRLTIVGSAPTGPIPDGVTVVGRVPASEIASFYASADLLCVPTYHEAFGVAYVEALQTGIPCVGTTVGNVAWIIDDAGHCVTPGDVDGLTSAIIDVFERYSHFAMAAASRGAYLARTHTWGIIAGSLLAALHEDSA